MRDVILQHLAAFVACDTANPPRAIASSGVLEYVERTVTQCGFDTELHDDGDGCFGLLATRGAPRRLFNAHLDTVPACEGWSDDPLRLRVDGERAIGLGACDIKGAAAALLAAIEHSSGDAALLFTTDEEAGTSRCVNAFLSRNSDRFDDVVVAEPTNCSVVTAHRGIASVDVTFPGAAMHTSRPNADRHNANHAAASWCAELLDQLGPQDVRLNLGVIHGGTKANVTASSTTVTLGLRPFGPTAPVLSSLRATLPAGCEWRVRFTAPPLLGTASPAIAEQLGAPLGDAVDFWTEAALFAEAGMPAAVFGPGDIAQAHTADEWVSVVQLETAAHSYAAALDAPATHTDLERSPTWTR